MTERKFRVKITQKEVEHVAKLGRLELAEQEKTNLTDQLSNILTYVEKLNELDTKGVTPTSHVLDISNVMREDVPHESLSQDKALSNAPEKAAGHYKVPKIIE
jgi:aspartyl-tRNA(Asn)/glutamyl-tRNA(Gln) amidotransferase subunit C